MSWVMKDYVIAIILFSTVVALGYIMLNGLATDYSNTDIVDPKFSENYNKLSETTQVAENIRESISSEEGLGLIGTTEILLKGTFSVINLVLSSLTTLASQVFQMAITFEIPSEISGVILVAFLAIITVSIIFIIINYVNRSGRM